MRIKNGLLALLGAFIVFIDQIAKLLVINNLSDTDSVHVIPGLFDFVYVKNTGAAFSILSDSTLLLGVISVLFCIGVAGYWYIKKPQHNLLKISMTLLLAGAFGNAIDRLFRGYVVDFIQTVFIRFPVFNVADIAITFGAMLLIIYLLFFDGKEEKDGKVNSDGGQSE
ncbi:MAG: signal peptidase II [Clostridiales bacterium]|nr:signal peptidase II [Clostridiales bacterium]